MSVLSTIYNFKVVFDKRYVFAYKSIFLAIWSILFSSHTLAQDYEWAKSVGGTNYEEGNSIIVDASGNVYIAGTFHGTADFDPGAGIANLTSTGGSDVFFAKYDVNGNYLWAKSIGKIENYHQPSIAVDALGNVYLTGTFEGTVDFDPGIGTANLTSAGNYDIFFAKYSANGDYLWAKSVGGPYFDEGRSIAVDASGNVHITGSCQETVDFDPGAGTSYLTAGMLNMYFAKYNTNGEYLWAKVVTGDYSDGNSIAVDASGHVYVTGHFYYTTDFDPGVGTANLTPVGSYDAFFAKYTANGDYVWAKNIGGIDGENAYSIAVDALGYIYIAGMFWVTADFDPGAGIANLTSVGKNDVFFAKYDSNGNYLWAKRVGSTYYDDTPSLAIDAFGSVYLTGFFYNTVDFDPGIGTANLTSAGNQDVFFAKYDANGNYIWAKSVGGFGYENSYSIATDAFGSVYIVGTFPGTVDFDPGEDTTNLISDGTSVFFAKYTQASPCPHTVTHSGSVVGGIYTAGQYITATGRLWGNTIYNAGMSVTLLPGFEADTGKVFEAKIQGCE